MPDDLQRRPLLIAWTLPNGTQCVVGSERGEWVVTIDSGGALVARSVFASAADALAHADQQRLRFSQQPEQ